MSYEKLRACFCQALGISPHAASENLAYNAIPEWDSVGHMALVAELEHAFDVMFETDDILGMSSFDKTVEILQRLGVSFDDA